MRLKYTKTIPYSAMFVFIFCLFMNAHIARATSNIPAGVSIHQLDNGMKVLLIENQALPMVGVNVVIKVGSAYETFATSGMSHMLEHLLFNGTTSRSQKQLYDDVDRIGGYNNANTSEYYTNFMMVTPAENIKAGMELQADMLFNSVLPEKKFNKEKGIVLEEISKSLADANEQVERNTISLLYKGHALSLPTLGTYATIEAMDRDQVFEFYKNNYVPNNMLLSVVGNFNSAQMLKMVSEIYGATAPGEIYRDQNTEWSVGFNTNNLVPATDETIYQRFFDGEQNQLQLFYKICSNKSAAFYQLLETQLEKKENKLNTTIEDTFNDTVQSVKMVSRISPVLSFIQVRLNISPQADIQKIKNWVTTKLTAADWAFSAEELATEAGKARTDFLKNIEKPHMFGIYNAYTFAVNGIEGVLASYQKSEYEKANQLLENFRIKSKPVSLIQNPAQQSETTEAAQINTGLTFPSNGKTADLIVRQNATSQLLAIHYLIKHKAPLESKYGKEAAKILHNCFGQRMKSRDIAKLGSAWGISIKENDNPFIPMDNRYMNPDYGYIRVESLAENVSGVINHLTKQMVNFVPTMAEYQQATAKMGKPNPMMMMGKGDKAKDIFEKAYKELIYEENPYPENTEKPTYDQLLEFSKEYFIPANMIISVVSPELPEKVNKFFSAFSSDGQILDTPVYTKRLKVQVEGQNIDEPGGGNRSYLFWGFSTEIDPKDKAALQALSIILRDRIIFDIREKQGMAYHMSAGIEMIDNRALFFINQGTRPQNVDVLLPQYPEFFNMTMLDDVSEADLEKSLNMYLGRMMFRRLSSINQGYYLGHSFYFNKDMNYDTSFLDQLKEVRLSEVKNIAKKYMKVNNTITVIIR